MHEIGHQDTKHSPAAGNRPRWCGSPVPRPKGPNPLKSLSYVILVCHTVNRITSCPCGIAHGNVRTHLSRRKNKSDQNSRRMLPPSCISKNCCHVFTIYQAVIQANDVCLEAAASPRLEAASRQHNHSYPHGRSQRAAAAPGPPCLHPCHSAALPRTFGFCKCTLPVIMLGSRMSNKYLL